MHELLVHPLQGHARQAARLLELMKRSNALLLSSTTSSDLQSSETWSRSTETLMLQNTELEIKLQEQNFERAAQERIHRLYSFRLCSDAGFAETS